MKYLATFENYNTDFDYQPLLEKSEMKQFKTIADKTINKLSLGFYFAATYTWGVTMLYPIVDALIKNSDVPNITKEQVVLLTLFSITQILNMANNDVKKLRSELEKDNLLELSNKIKDSLLSIQKVFSFVSRGFGKVVNTFIDMIAYVTLGVPFTMVMVDLVTKDGLNLDTLPQKLLVMGAGAGVYTLHTIVETLIQLIKAKMKK